MPENPEMRQIRLKELLRVYITIAEKKKEVLFYI